MKPQTDIGKTLSVVSQELDGSKVSSISTSIYPMQQRLLKWVELIGLRESDLVEPAHGDFLSQIEVSLQERRAFNLHAILQLALKSKNTRVPQGQLDPEWWFSFIQLAQEVYSNAMQILWSKILEIEVINPGSISVGTLKVLGSLSSKDAKLFNLVLNISMQSASDSVPMVISGYQRAPKLFQFSHKHNQATINIGRFGLNYPAILSLTQLGLLFQDEIASDEFVLGKRQQWQYGETQFYLAAKEKGLRLRYYKMTNCGAELAKVLKRGEQSQYFIEMKKILKKQFEMY